MPCTIRLISRVQRPLFIFLHLYFGPCSRDVSIYFLALCACIVRDVCMYIYICSSDFRFGNLVLCSKALGKHRLGPHQFKSQTSKPPCMQSPDSQCQNHVFTANFPKLRFYQNKGLSLDKRCRVPNTSPHETKLSDLRIKIFCHPH